MKNILQLIFQDLKKIFAGTNLFWHFLAILLTYLIVISELDWKVFLLASSSPGKAFFYPALLLGTVLPILLPLGMLFFGWINKNKKSIQIGLMLAEAAFFGMLVSSGYKALTGRVQPPAHFHSTVADVSNLIDNSHQFQFGFFRHGIFWGWPSSHTTIAFSMSIALWVFFRRNKLIQIGVVAYAFYVGLGVTVSSIHWFSEMVAGGIIGQLIGNVVGRSFLEKGKKDDFML